MRQGRGGGTKRRELGICCKLILMMDVWHADNRSLSTTTTWACRCFIIVRGGQGNPPQTNSLALIVQFNLRNLHQQKVPTRCTGTIFEKHTIMPYAEPSVSLWALICRGRDSGSEWISIRSLSTNQVKGPFGGAGITTPRCH